MKQIIFVVGVYSWACGFEDIYTSGDVDGVYGFGEPLGWWEELFGDGHSNDPFIGGDEKLGAKTVAILSMKKMLWLAWR